MTPEEIAKEIRENLARWDRGASVWSVEMGGLGPGYEQAIQILAVELVRDHVGKALPTDEKEIRAWGNDTVHRIDAACGGFSGGQVDGAMNIAQNILSKGWEAAVKSAPENRKIQVSKWYPHVEWLGPNETLLG